MKLKTLIATVAALAAISLIVFLVQRRAPAPSTDARVNRSLVDTSQLEPSAKVRLAEAGKTVILARQPDGSWQVENYHGLPADFSRLSRLVSELTAARIQRLVTTNPERLARLEFKDTQIAFLDSADQPLWSVTLGRTADSGGRYVRFGDEGKGYLANLTTWLDAEPKNWANTQLVDLRAADIAKVELSFPEANRGVTATRPTAEEPFTAENPPEGRQLKQGTVTTLLNTFTTLRFSDTAAPDDPRAIAAREHARTVKLTTFDGKTVTLTVGRKPEEKVVKAPAPSGGSTNSGPAAILGGAAKETSDGEPRGPAKALESLTETIPAGPVYAHIESSDAAAPVNALMQKRAYQIYEYTLTNLPKTPEDMFEPAPAPTPPGE